MKLSKFLTTLGVTATLVTAQMFGLPNQKPQEAQAQTTGRPYVVFVNGYQDCCAWGRYTNGSPDPFMDIVINTLPSNSEIVYVPWDRFENGTNQRSSTSNDALFLSQAEAILDNLNPNRPLILIGHSFGGDSIISLLSRIDRSIQFVGVIDPTAAGGFREPITRRTIPSTVSYFFNRWQKNGLGGDNVVPFDSRLVDGKVRRCDATRDCDQTDQNLARTSNGAEIRVSCGRLEVTCPGYEPWPGGSNGTKAKRLEHNNMPLDEYLQTQMANKIQQALANFTPTNPNLGRTPVFDASFYINVYGDLRNAFGSNQESARNHWISKGIKEGRGSSPAFDVRYYLEIHADLQNAFGRNNYAAAVNHWLSNGIREGRKSSLVFDVRYYLGRYPDLQNAFGRNNYAAAVNHWLSNGIREGRQGSADFDPRYYLSNNPDVARAFGANNYQGAITHYLTNGKREGRRGTP